MIPSQAIFDTYHGQTIEDPYRHLEDLEDSTVISWLQAQETLAKETLNHLSGRDKLIEEQQTLDASNKGNIRSIRKTSKGQYFYLKKKPTDLDRKLYMRENLNGPEKFLYELAPIYSKEGYRIRTIAPDGFGSKVAISISKSGEEISKIITLDIVTKKLLPGVITQVNPSYGGIHWHPDDSGFITMYFPFTDPKDPKYSLQSKAMYYNPHQETPTPIDVFSMTSAPETTMNPEDFPYIRIANKGYVLGEVGGTGAYSDMYIKPIKDLLAATPWQKLYTKSDQIKKVVIAQDQFIFLSAKNASNFRICSTPIAHPNFKNPTILVAEDKHSVITDIEVTRDGIFFVRVQNGVVAKLYRYTNGQEKEIALPNPSGTALIKSLGIETSYLSVVTRGWTTKNTRYRYDTNTNKFEEEKLIESYEYPEFKDFIIEEIEIPSHDGVLLPVSLVYKKGLKKDRNNRTLLYTYGSYGTSVKPFFFTHFLNWVAQGGIMVVPHVRGGSEKGDAWHKAGYKTTKPNTWKDMIACTQYMIDHNYTSPQKTVLWGTSAGGIMAGRAMTDRPDLYAAVIMLSPSLNLVRSEIQPNGLNSVKEFGTVQKEAEFKALLEMDSYHQLQKNTAYPAVLIKAGIKDGRVVAWDPAKFMAKLQAYNTSDKPILFDIDFGGGHGATSASTTKKYNRYADIFAFAYWQTGHPDYQPRE
ncbi:prolyl oligopeptidase family serine peptidase [Aquimarina sp. 2201CG1-2-11]|uniref:prolyl oligopeptidase family serine peptidase n=1 Tax=Aquimarina discodermiae TaxID=3231043 RepID=UPI0034628AD1